MGAVVNLMEKLSVDTKGENWTIYGKNKVETKWDKNSYIKAYMILLSK